MAAKLKNLKIRKVDFVDEGANPEAHIRLLKQKDGQVQTEDGEGGKGCSSILKRLFSFIGKAAGMNQDEIDSAVDEIKKGDAMSFGEKFNEAKNRKIADEIWDICYALQSSLISILNDEDMDSSSSAEAMEGSLDEFRAVVQESIAVWSSGRETGIVRKSEEISGAELEIMKSSAERLNETIRKVCKGTQMEKHGKHGLGNKGKMKGEEEEMEIDKSKLTDAERAFLDSIEKRYSIKNGGDLGNGGAASSLAPTKQAADKQDVTKSAKVQAEDAPVQQEDDPDNIYKGLHPAVRAELEGLKKFREEAEDRELKGIAKKYAVIGKKEEELVPMLKGLKASGGTAYSDMLAVLDQALDTVEKSGVFSEIGKSGHGGGGVNQAETKIEGIAKGYMEKDPGLSYYAALAKAWEDNPDIMEEYDTEAGF